MGTTLSSNKQYVILVRHASRDFDSHADESRQSMQGWDPKFGTVRPEFEVKGLPVTLAIANRLADELGEIKVTHIRHSPHTVAAETAQAYRWILRQRNKADDSCSVESVESLDPGTGSVSEVIECLRSLTTSDAPGSAVVVVGHQPGLTTLASALAVKKLPAYTLPIGGSEAAANS